jgi:hypothetical protein
MLSKMRLWGIILIVFTGLPLTAQSTALTDSVLLKTICQTNLLQIESTLLTNPDADSLVIQLYQDAKQFAEDGNWTDANIILETIFEILDISDGSSLLNQTNREDQTPFLGLINPIKSANTHISRFEIESGVDYSQQEFELSFIENDSVLVEQLQSPYIGLSYYQTLAWNQNEVFINPRFRTDNNYLNFQLYGSFERRRKENLIRLELDNGFFHPNLTGETNFFDHRIQLLVGRPGATKHRWYLTSRFRYKWYLDESGNLNGSTNITSFSGSLFWEPEISSHSRLRFNYTPTVYSERSRYGYNQHQLTAGYRFLRGYTQYLYFNITATTNHFHNDTGSEIYKNQYFAITPELTGEIHVGGKISLNTEIGGEVRRHEHSDAVMPDYNNFSLSVLPKYNWDEFKSLGFGGFVETQSHLSDLAEEAEFIAEADYFSKGVIASVEWMGANGLMINLRYTLSWRDYPNAGDKSIFETFYTNRRVNSLFVMGWVPLGKQLVLQCFANYDNDQDRSELRNDSRNTLLNIGFQYRF